MLAAGVGFAARDDPHAVVVLQDTPSSRGRGWTAASAARRFRRWANEGELAEVPRAAQDARPREVTETRL